MAVFFIMMFTLPIPATFFNFANLLLDKETNVSFRIYFYSESVRVRSHPEVFLMCRRQATFLVKQTLTVVVLNGIFSALAVFLAFRHMAIVPVYGNPSLITDSIFQTFIATLMSILPPSILTVKWMLSRPDLTSARTSMVRILIRALSTALAACWVSFMVLPIAMPRLLAASLPFWNMLFLKCLYGMAIGLAVTPFAVAAVLRGPRRKPETTVSIEQK